MSSTVNDPIFNLFCICRVLMVKSVTSSGAGRVEPIPLNIKTGRQYFFPCNGVFDNIMGNPTDVLVLFCVC